MRSKWLWYTQWWGRCCEDGAGEVGGRGKAGNCSHVKDFCLYPQSSMKILQCLKSVYGFITWLNSLGCIMENRWKWGKGEEGGGPVNREGNVNSPIRRKWQASRWERRWLRLGSFSDRKKKKDGKHLEGQLNKTVTEIEWGVKMGYTNMSVCLTEWMNVALFLKHGRRPSWGWKILSLFLDFLNVRWLWDN